MAPDPRAAAIAAFALLCLCAAPPADAQTAPGLGLPGNLRDGPYAAITKMLPPSASTSLTDMIAGVGVGAANPTVLIENRGTAELSLAVVGPDGICGRHSVRPNDIVAVRRCGGRLRWHDSREVKEIETKEGGVYQFFWTGDRWGLADVTADRFQ